MTNALDGAETMEPRKPARTERTPTTMIIKTFAAAAAAATMVLTASGCSADHPPEAAAAPPSGVYTPPPTAVDVAYQKAETAYRNAFHLMNFGVQQTKPTPAQMKKYMTGSYLDIQTRGGLPYKLQGAGYLDGVATAGYVGTADSPTTVNLTGCEDLRAVVAFKDGKKVTPTGSRLYVQHIVATKGSDGVWRLANLTGTDKIATPDWASQVCSSSILDEKPTR